MSRMTRDPGLQPERTALAWQRTGVAGAALAGSATLAAAHLSPPGVLLLVTGLAVLCAVAATVAATSAGRKERLSSPWVRLLAVAAIPVLLCVVGILLALASGG